MKVDIVLPDVQPIETPTQVYLEGMKGYPNSKCEPYVVANVAQFNLPLLDFYECGVTRVINQLTVCITRSITRILTKILMVPTNRFHCCLRKIESNAQGKKVYYHKIIIETNDNKEFVSVKCISMALPTYNVTRHSHSIARRDVLPPGFEEPM